MTDSNAYKQLIALLVVFIVGIFAIVSVNFVFVKLVEKLEIQTVNYKAKIAIGDFIAYDITQLEGLFYELATTSSNQRMVSVLNNKIYQVIENLEQTLEVLENGGTLKRVVRLNIVDLNSIEKEIIYQKDFDGKLVLESLDIRPKMDEFIELKEKLIELVGQRQEALGANNLEEFSSKVRQLRLFYRSVPAFFIRFAENNSRLLYEAEMELGNIEQQIIKKKQEYFLIELLLVGIILGLVMLLGYIIARNINKTNQDLEYQKHFVRGILDAQSNIVIVTSGDKIIDANRALFEFLEEFDTLEEFLEKHDCICDYFIPFENDKRYILKQNYGEDNWAEFVYHHKMMEHLVAIKKNNELHHFKLSIDKQSFLNDEHILVVALNDITTQVEAQKELKQLNESLETKVKAKTQELQDFNDNLQQKIIIEVEKNRKKDQQLIQQSRYAALGEMIGNIAHQWRQPLSAISTTATGIKYQMELGMIESEKVMESFDDITNYVQFLDQTIEDFRGFFRQDSKKESFNLVDSIQNTLKIVSSAYKDNHIKIFTNFQKSDIQIFGSPSELSQVFLNILGNAKDILVDKKSQSKKIHIKVEVKEKEVFVYVQDNGGGVPEDIIEKVFDPYFTTKHKSQGTGIGLYMSKEIVEKKFGGFLSVKNKDITLDDESFDGACFIITLPLIQS